MMIAGKGVHPVLVVSSALAQDFLAHYRNAEHLTEEVTTCSGRDRALR